MSAAATTFSCARGRRTIDPHGRRPGSCCARRCENHRYGDIRSGRRNCSKTPCMNRSIHTWSLRQTQGFISLCRHCCCDGGCPPAEKQRTPAMLPIGADGLENRCRPLPSGKTIPVEPAIRPAGAATRIASDLGATITAIISFSILLP